MKTKDLYCGRLDLFRHLGCKVDGVARVWRTEIRNGTQRVLLLNLQVMDDEVQHLRVKNNKMVWPNDKVKVEGTVGMYARNTKVGLRNVLLSLI